MKRGSVYDIIVILVILLGFAIMSLFGYVIIKTGETQLINSHALPDLSIEQYQRILGFYDYLDIGAVVIFISMSVTTILLARNLPSHPAYFILSVVTLVILSIFVYILQSIYDGIATEPVIATFANAFPKTAILLSNMGYLYLGLSIILLLVIYNNGEDTSANLPI